MTLLLLVQPVFATEESSTTPVDLENADIVSAVRTVSALPSNWNPLSAPNSEKQWLFQQIFHQKRIQRVLNYRVQIPRFKALCWMRQETY